MKASGAKHYVIYRIQKLKEQFPAREKSSIVGWRMFIVTLINAIQTQLKDMQSAGVSISRIDELLLRQSSVKDSKSEIVIDRDSNISINDISFTYDKDDDILKNISFRIEKG